VFGCECSRGDSDEDETIDLRGAAALDVAGLLPRPAKADLHQSAGRVLTPEMFGAKGDGVTNDSMAHAELAKVVNAKHTQPHTH